LEAATHNQHTVASARFWTPVPSARVQVYQLEVPRGRMPQPTAALQTVENVGLETRPARL